MKIVRVTNKEQRSSLALIVFFIVFNGKRMIFFYFIGLVLCEEKRYESYDMSHLKIDQSGNYGAKKD